MQPHVISLCQHQKLHKVVRVVYFSFSFFLSHLFNSFISGFWLRTTVAWCHIRRLEDKRWLGRELILGGLSGVLVRTPELNIYWWSLCDAGGVPHMLYVPRPELTLYVQQNQIRWMPVMVLDRCTAQEDLRTILLISMFVDIWYLTPSQLNRITSCVENISESISACKFFF